MVGLIDVYVEAVLAFEFVLVVVPVLVVRVIVFWVSIRCGSCGNYNCSVVVTTVKLYCYNDFPKQI